MLVCPQVPGSHDTHDSIRDPTPADTIQHTLGQWVFNNVEWEWKPGKKVPPDSRVVCWRIPYPVDSDSEPSPTNLQKWFWDIVERIQEVILPRAGHTRLRETETHLGQWLHRVQWYPVFPPQVGRTLDSSMHHEGWQAAQIQDCPAEGCPCQLLATHTPAIMDPSIGHVRTANITPLLDKARHDRSVFLDTAGHAGYH